MKFLHMLRPNALNFISMLTRWGGSIGEQHYLYLFSDLWLFATWNYLLFATWNYLTLTGSEGPTKARNLLGVSTSGPVTSIATLGPDTNWFTIPCNNYLIFEMWNTSQNILCCYITYSFWFSFIHYGNLSLFHWPWMWKMRNICFR
jgi:hypothetical protein